MGKRKSFMDYIRENFENEIYHSVEEYYNANKESLNLTSNRFYEVTDTYLDEVSIRYVNAEDCNSKGMGITTIKYKDWIQTWLDLYVKPMVKIRTYEKYAQIARNRIVPHLGEENLDELVLKNYNITLFRYATPLQLIRSTVQLPFCKNRLKWRLCLGQ